MIENNELSTHAAIQSERALAVQHDVSRMTARRALEALEGEGLIYSDGRRGRFVSPKRLRYNVSEMVSFAASAKAQGTELIISTVSQGATKATPQLAQALAINIDDPLFEYTRVFRNEGHATFLETEYVIASRFPDFLEQDLQQSTTQLIEQHYQTRARTGDIVIRMRAASDQESELLGVNPHHAVIELVQTICDKDGVPFCYGRQVWRGELAEFSVKALVN